MFDPPPRFKFHPEVGCLTLTRYGYIFWKDVTVSAIIFDKFNKKFPRVPNQPRLIRPDAIRDSEESVSETASSRRVHPPSIPPTESPTSLPVYSIPLRAPPQTHLPHLPNQEAPVPLSDGYADLCLSESDNSPVFEEMVSSKNLNPINTGRIKDSMWNKSSIWLY